MGSNLRLRRACCYESALIGEQKKPAARLATDRPLVTGITGRMFETGSKPERT
ncbi:MAG TPA: hypothetical protein VIX73_19895 [Kofleriaceae bacterium]|jgi:hypothetical protein